MNIDQITNELKNLSDKINLIDNNVKFNLQMFWAVIAVIVAVLALAIYFLVKQFIKNTIENELDKKLEELRQRIVKEITYEDEKFHATLINGWTSLEDYERLDYWRDNNGFVHLKGVISGGVINHSACYLPKGYRPNNKVTIPVITYEKIGTATINIDGEVHIDKINNQYVEFNVQFKSTI